MLESYNEAETERHDTWDSVKNEIGAHGKEMDELKAAILIAIGEENKETFQECVQVNFWVFFWEGGGYWSIHPSVYSLMSPFGTEIEGVADATLAKRCAPTV